MDSGIKEPFSIKKLIGTIVLLIISILFLLPFVWMLSASFKVESDVFSYPIQWIPQRWNAIANYKEIWLGANPFYKYYANSIIVSVATTAISCVVSALAAYGFTKIDFKGRNGMFLMILATYMVPGQAILVPQFILYRNIGLFDSLLGLIIINCFSVLGTFMLRQFFMSLSTEYIESGKIDGASHARIFWQIALPLVRPSVATYAILRFIWTWNDYQNPLIFIRSDKWYTIQLAMQKFASLNGEFYSLIMAAAVSAILPLLIIFIIGQKNVIEGIALGGVKG